ncbi:Proteasome subunit beta type-3 [Galemys pyrenaicus]|uniref:Proteasome subunit beta type-3 n=1 Tax=Galemys pyrenaicus TaxID=202257 RepID=A0A8J6DNW8_GALPY|nr:Proteasome subunit beta type-3 [Galemys pyrenaicus]
MLENPSKYCLSKEREPCSETRPWQAQRHELKEGGQIKLYTLKSLVANLLSHWLTHVMLNAVEWYAVSGMGVIVHIIEKDKIISRTSKAQMD